MRTKRKCHITTKEEIVEELKQIQRGEHIFSKVDYPNLPKMTAVNILLRYMADIEITQEFDKIPWYYGPQDIY